MNINHTENRFQGCKGHDLYCQCWLPDAKPKAVLLLVHGLAEHSGRYMNLVNYFVPQGYAIYGIDHQGHGKSSGPRVYVDRFSDYLDDLKAFFDRVREKQPEKKIFMLGHSVGGTIATAYAVRYQDGLDGLILSAPALQVGASISRLSIMVAKALSYLMPKLGISALDTSAISRDQSVVDAYVNDPLVYNGKITARLGYELVDVIEKKLPPRLAQINLPLMVMYGSADQLSNPKGSMMLYERISSGDKTLKRYEGLYHEIFNEPEQQQVFEDVAAWLDTRT